MRKERIAIINGPNINILGKREPKIYGKVSWHEIEKGIKIVAEQLEVEIFFFQSNHEGEIVDYIQNRGEVIDGIVINPAAFTNSGYAILEALLAVEIPFVEVHISNIFARSGWHRKTIFAQEAIGHISGFKEHVYIYGLEAMCDYLRKTQHE